MKSHEEAEVRQGQHVWAPRLEVEGAPIPWDATLWDSRRGHATILAEALQQPLLLPKDMEGLRRTKQLDLFMSLKRNLAMVSQLAFFFFFFVENLDAYLFIGVYA